MKGIEIRRFQPGVCNIQTFTHLQMIRLPRYFVNAHLIYVLSRLNFDSRERASFAAARISRYSSSLLAPVGKDLTCDKRSSVIATIGLPHPVTSTPCKCEPCE